jgi:hypothetical protein
MKLFNQTILSPEGHLSGRVAALSRVAHLSALCSRTAVRLCICGCLLLFAACSKDVYYQVLDTYPDTPPQAASSKAWVFDDQTWSDAIHVPECNKETFEDSYTNPQCRSYKTYYYYNWPYVDANAANLCPSPWRVPSKGDFEMLTLNFSAAILCAEWGYGGSSSLHGVDTHASYWAFTVPKLEPNPENESDLLPDPNNAYLLNYHSGHSDVPYDDRNKGLMVRCVK